MNFYYIPSILILAKSLVAHAEASGFPAEAWDPKLHRDIPRAIAFVETQATEFHLDEPPADDSQETYSEIDYLKEIAITRSARDIILITKENLHPNKRFFEVLEIDSSDHPRTLELILWISEQSYLPVLYFKHKFSRTRPYQIDTDLSTVIDGPGHASYPSGHATQGYLTTQILADLLPRSDPRQEALLELGLTMGTRREIAGVHYPSDTEAGVELAKQLKVWLMKKENFEDKFQAARIELSRTVITITSAP